MPAVSKDQQRAAGAALAAKKAGKEPTNPVSKQMAKSMSIEELEKLASTKHDDLPEKINEEEYHLSQMIEPDTSTDKIKRRAIIQASAGKTVTLGPNDEWSFWYSNSKNKWMVKLPDDPYPHDFDSTEKAVSFFVKSWLDERKTIKTEDVKWFGRSLSEIFKEEADKKEQITTQKSKKERLKDKEIKTGKDTEDTWTSTTGGSAPSGASHSKNSMSSNTAGAVVAEQRHFLSDFEEDEWYDPTEKEIGFSEQESEVVSDIIEHLLFHYEKYGTYPNKWLPEDVLGDVIGYYSGEPEDVEKAKEAIETAQKTVEAREKKLYSNESKNGPNSEVIFEVMRWKQLSGIKTKK